MYFTEEPSPDPSSLTVEFLVGRRITAIDASAAPNSWVFHFDGVVGLTVETLWRLISERRIVLTSEDHQQSFGLPAPVDASAQIGEAIGDKPILATHLDPTTGDLTLEFAARLRLEVIVSSAGYENWTVWKPDGTQLVAMGGGRVALFRSAAG